MSLQLTPSYTLYLRYSHEDGVLFSPVHNLRLHEATGYPVG